MKWQASISAAGTLLLWFATQVAQAVPIISVQAPTVPIAIGDTVTVNIVISDVVDLYGFQFDLIFDPTVLAAAADPVEGNFLLGGGSTIFIAGTVSGSTISATAGSLLTAIDGVSGNGILASFSFSAIGSGTGAFSIAEIILLDSRLNFIESSATGGAVTVLPASTSVPEPATPALLMLGLVAIWRRGRSFQPRT
jgi:hypothetical protein